MTTAIEAADVKRTAVRVRARGDGFKPWKWRLIVWGGLIVAWAVAAAVRDSILFPGPGATASAIGTLLAKGTCRRSSRPSASCSSGSDSRSSSACRSAC